ncbi:hypothetical protein TUM17576_08430 [Enterobacter hormaechei]|nr:hypothetical protein TUM17576_08430 [Enterobacter hormaechei]
MRRKVTHQFHDIRMASISVDTFKNGIHGGDRAFQHLQKLSAIKQQHTGDL